MTGHSRWGASAASDLATLAFPGCCTDHCALRPGGTQCGFSLFSSCDALDFCDGASPECPNLVKPDGTPCDVGNPCAGTSACNAGTCVPETFAPPGTNCLPPGFDDPCVLAECDSAGGCMVQPTTNPCDDGDACTTDDTCGDFYCQGGPPPACGPCDVCDSFDGCVAEIQPGCQTPLSEKSSLTLKDTSDDSRDKLTWKFVNGPLTPTTAFGDPVASTSYSLCVYDDSGVTPSLVVAATAPAGSSWLANTKGFNYRNASLDPDGIRKVQLKAGDSGKTKLAVKGAGPHLGLPPTPFTLATPVVVQLKADTGMCWQTTFTTPLVSNPIAFKAKGGP